MSDFVKKVSSRVTVVMGVLIALLCLSVVPAHAGADENDAAPIEAAGSLYNGYYIDNQSNDTFHYVGYVQPGGKECVTSQPAPGDLGETICEVHATGWGTPPPMTIPPHTKEYFDVPAGRDIYHGRTYDDTAVVYMNKSNGELLTVHANAVFFWRVGIFPTFENDLSSCTYMAGATNVCHTKPTTGRGKKNQTVFTIPAAIPGAPGA